MTDDPDDDLFGDDAIDDDVYGQDGPDLFGLGPDEVIVAHEASDAAPVDVDLDEDTFDEIPIDATDEPENQVTPAQLGSFEPERSDEDAPATDSTHADEQAVEESTPAAELAPPPARPASINRDDEDDAPLALYRRYRPDTFAEVIGQEHVTEPLQRALANNRVNHAYLFSGPRGCGKTTSARILARCLNCEEGPTPVPCGHCQSCRDLARGGPGSIDVIEIDAASHGGVDAARDLRERAFFAPVASRFKIYIIDEAHMVTKEGFNALLKLVEEPPPHVKFIFATTEPDKVLGTIRSRTHHYPFRLVPPKALTHYLAQLCEAEGVAVDPAALPLVVRAGAGSVRDSLSVLDQLLGGAGPNGVTYQQAASLLGFTPDTLLDEIMDAFAAHDANGVFACIDKVMEVGQDPRRFAEDLLRRLRDLIIVAAVPDALTSGLVDVSGDQADRLTVQAQGMGPGELTRAAEVIAKGLTEMRGTTAPRLYLELMCSRVLLPGADVDARGVHARLDRIERRLNMVGASDEPVSAVAAPPAPASARPEASPAWGPEPEAVPSFGAGESARDAAYAAARRAREDGQTRPQSAPQTQNRDPRPERPAQASTEPPRREPVRPAQPTPEMPRPPEVPREPEQPPQGRPERGTSASLQVAQPSMGTPSASDPSSLSTSDLRAIWPQVLDAVKSRRRVTWIVLSQNAQVSSLADGVLTLAMSSAGAKESFGRGGSPDILREALIEVAGIAPTIETVVDTPDGSPRGGAPGSFAGGTRGRVDPPRRPSPSAEPRAAAPAPAGPPPQTAPVGRPHPAPVHDMYDDEPPPEEDEPEHVSFAELARENIRPMTTGPHEVPDEAPQSRSDADLTELSDVDELLKSTLGAERIDEPDSQA